ncbi:efflux RND transporter periplasmic adaptor subunit [Vallitaleaceae bacterium 9-2]
MKKKLSIGLIIFVIVASGTLVYYSQMPKKVAGYTVSTGDYEEGISAVGYVEYEIETSIQAEVSGKLNEIYIQEGDKVAQGAIIASIDDVKARQMYQDLEGALVLAQSRYEDYLKNYEAALRNVSQQRQTKNIEIDGYKLAQQQLDTELIKLQQLYDEGVISYSELESVKNEQEVIENNIEVGKASLNALNNPALISKELKASVDVAKEQLDQQALELNKYSIHSPFEAVILDIYINQGELVQAGQDIMQIGLANKKVVWVEVDEKYIGTLAIGQEAMLTAEAYADQTFTGRITGFDSQVNKETGTIGVKVEVVEGREALIRNMSVRVEVITTSLNDVVLIPGDYLYGDNPTTVLVINAQGRVETRPIKIQNQNKEMIYVMDGLAPQDIIVAPLDIAPGDRVEIQEVINDAV